MTTIDETTQCAICSVAMPAARSVLGKAIGTAAFSALGLSKSIDPIARLAMFLIGLGLGHVVDRLIADLAKPICGTCRRT